VAFPQIHADPGPIPLPSINPFVALLFSNSQTIKPQIHFIVFLLHSLTLLSPTLRFAYPINLIPNPNPSIVIRCRIGHPRTRGPRFVGTVTKSPWTPRKVGGGERIRWWRFGRTVGRRACRRRDARVSSLSRFLRQLSLLQWRRRSILSSLE